ncbi:MAG: hypothetical protein IIC11_00970 [Proteobacteria bacterium]|nr:hypothetical protein [Pseudomonadota bacterium]
MSEAKIEIQIGAVKFSGEGDKNWLSEQLDKILENAKELVALASPAENSDPAHQEADFSNATSISSQPLATFLKSKNATTAQIDKFLATAVWCESKGKNRLKTNDITSALKKATQSKLANAADCLNKNVSKGYCEKDGKEFSDCL